MSRKPAHEPATAYDYRRALLLVQMIARGFACAYTFFAPYSTNYCIIRITSYIFLSLVNIGSKKSANKRVSIGSLSRECKTMDANTLLHKIRFAVNTLMRIANDAEAWREFAASDTDTRSVVVDRIEMNMVRFMEQLVNEAHGKESEAE